MQMHDKHTNGSDDCLISSACSRFSLKPARVIFCILFYAVDLVSEKKGNKIKTWQFQNTLHFAKYRRLPLREFAQKLRSFLHSS